MRISRQAGENPPFVFMKSRICNSFLIIILTGLILVSFFVISNRTLRSPLMSPEDKKDVAFGTELILEFPVIMDIQSVESRIHSEPEMELVFQWQENRIFIQPGYDNISEDTFTLYLQKGSSTQDGRTYLKDFSWSYTLRTACIAYIGNATTSPEIWVIDPVDGKASQVTKTGGRISGFVAKPDRSGFIYSLLNDRGGSDIRQINFDGTGDRVLVDCGRDTCSDPVITRDGNTLAFTRNRNPGSVVKTKERFIYTVSLGGWTVIPKPVIAGKAITGKWPVFSPDGRYLSFYDGKNHGIRVVNLYGGKDFILGTSREQSGTWSPDSSRLAFLGEKTGHDGMTSPLYIVDVESATIRETMKEFIFDKDMGEPDWSPDGKTLIAGIRQLNTSVARQLWLLHLDEGENRQLTEDYSRMNAAPRWRPDGLAVVYQQAELGRTGVKPTVNVWDVRTGNHTVIVEDAALPEWVP